MGKKLYKLLAGLLIFATCFVLGEPYMAYTEGEKVKVGIYTMDGFHYYDEDGELNGYCIDYLKVLSGLTSWEYEYVEVSDFSEGCEKLENKEIDLLAPAMMTDARKAKYAYSELSFGTEYTILVTKSDRDDLYYEDYEYFDQMKVAVLKGYPLTDFFITYMDTHGFSAELVYYNTARESKDALENGEVDAMVTSIMDIQSDEKLLARFAPQPFYFLTYKENTQLLGKLNDAMNRIQSTYPTLLDELLLDYYPVYECQYYTREETEYIENGKVLKVAYISDRKPLSFTGENGELNGISREIFDLISEISGLKFEYVELPTGSITYDFLQEQEIDLITGVEYNSENMNANGIFLSRPYFSSSKVVVSRPEFVYDPKQNYKLAVVEGSQTFRYVINAKYPNLEIVYYETVKDCFNAVYVGEADMLIQNQHVVESMLLKPIYSTFSVVSLEGLVDELCFSTIVSRDGKAGLGEDESALVTNILNKAISQISTTEMDNMVMRETLENKYEIEIVDVIYNYRFTITAIVFAFFVGMSLLAYDRKEKKKQKKLEEAENRRKALQQKRYQTIVECSDDLIYEISMDGESNIGSEKIKEKFGWEIPEKVDELDFTKAMEILHIHPDDEEIFRRSQITNTGEKFDDLTMRIGKADGSYIWCRISRTVLLDEDRKVVSILGKIEDVDEEVRERKQLEHRSRTDLLTGLLNKNTFEKEVRDYVEKNSTENACFVFLDMDHFKDINDKFGHSVGDQVIKETAKKIQLLFANFDLVGRFGGDEFCVFIKEIPRDTLIDRLKFAIKKMEQEYPYENGVVKLSASIGAAYCKRGDIGYKELLDVADTAAYRAKDNGRNCYIIEDIE